MNKEQREMLELIDSLKDKMKNALDSNDIENAKSFKAELEQAKEKLNLYKDLNEEIEIKNYVEVETMENNKNEILAFNKAIRGKSFDNALVREGDTDNGGYLVPQEQQTRIEELRRGMICLKDLCRVVNVNTITGVMPMEAGILGELANLTEGEEIPESEVLFGQVRWQIQDYGDIIPVSNMFLMDEKADFVDYCGRRFVKKSVLTENKQIMYALDICCQKNGKTPIAASGAEGYRAILKALNVELDIALKADAVIIVNQEGFNYLDALEDEYGRPLVVQSVQDPHVHLIRGHRIVVCDNATFPANEEKIQVYVANMEAAVAFFDRKGVEVAMSQEAGFTRNITYLRAIERFCVMDLDAEAVVKVEINKE